jgi:SAM-dependent methyltransferase
MFKPTDIYQQIVPDFLKRLIDPDSKRIQDFVLKQINRTNGGNHILDAGAGECRVREFIGNQHYVAIDAGCGDHTWNYSALDAIGDLEHGPIQEKLYDLVMGTQGLEHVKEPQLVLNELFRITKTGGRICISAPQGWGVHQAPFDFFRYTNFGLQHLIEKSGFKIDTITPSCGYFSYLANRLTVLPKTLFWQIKSVWLRVCLFPIELLAYLLFVICFPLILNSLDFLDREQTYTLNYFVLGKKPPQNDEL